jgi:peptidoglycan/xylan/chitin deacetylase (PgdA/CDA1 family)
MCPQSDNRAASAIFRVFGGAGKPCLAEACQHAGGRDMHVVEQRILAFWIPLTVWAATGSVLMRSMGAPAAMLAALPVGFVMLNLLAIALGGGTPVTQWRIWLSACTLWAVFHRDAGVVTGFFAWSWIALFLLNAAACLWLVVRKVCGLAETTATGWRLGTLIGLHMAALLAGWFIGWPWAVAGGALIAAWYCLAVLRPSCQWLGPVRCTTGDQSVLITIDDGPDPNDTPRLLDLLDEHQVRAVFFMIGEKVRRHPELAREVLRRGHQIGNHTMTHPQSSFWCAGPSRTRREIIDCQRVIEESTGCRPRFFRAPCGHRNLFTHPVAREAGLEVMAWTRRGFDAVEKDAGKALARILTKLAPGDIVLVHEATPIAVEMMEGLLHDRRCSGKDSGS